LDSSGKVELNTVVSNARLWSAETPNLYDLRLELQDKDGKVTESISRRIGIREVSIKDGLLLVNGVPVKLAGICRHDVYVPTGTVVDEKLWIKDLKQMKEANINAIRTSHYPYGSGFYDLCDKMGFYVIDELPYCWCPTDNRDMEPAFLQRARETVIRDKNHPSVIIWAVGNENKPGCNLQSVADLVRKLDPTRPRLVSEMLADKYGTDFDDHHYTAPDAVRKAGEDKARREKWPVIYTENPNVWDVRLGADFGCLDLWGEVLKRTWDVVWNYDGITGSFLWEWQDRAVADKCPTKLYHVDPDTGIQYLKTKGIVDGLRHPRPDYYHLKMVYSPIKVGEDIKTDQLPKSVSIDVTNHYSFTDLSALKAKWQLIRKGKSAREGFAHFKLAPRSSGQVSLAMPEDFASLSTDALRIDFEDANGVHVVGCQFALSNSARSNQWITTQEPPEGLSFPKLNLVVNETVNDKAFWRKITRHKGLLINAATEPSGNVDVDKLSLDQVKSLKADIVLEDDPKVIVGHIEAEYADGRFTYGVEWTGEKADIQELGWAFEMPKAYDRFSWKRQTPWSVYPDNHIGRPEGTARPDSCNVALTNVNRPDAHDFDSTKYECNLASLTNKDGQGLQVEFDPSCRHHVRARIDSSDSYGLVVNKVCSPPRDISSPVVKDFYTVLEKGDRIEGSFRIGSSSCYY
jgi:hypothetical protein